ncbi:Hypothetical_protein [Hexamita inflata]|uniref:Hypothetical_protein n=1 Tax=Hexamita inflata TaxID=28002 RepID=A0AA86URA2_9EUKA|nr:Hypothetical protein HINF_LOCUS49126 [Hexamita inflata]
MSDLSDIRMRAQNKTDSLWKPHQSVFGSPNSQTKNIDTMTSSDRSLRQQLEFTTQQNKNLQKSVNSMLSKIFQLEEQLASNPQKYKQGEAKQAPVELNELRTLEQQYEKQLYNMMQDKDQQIAQLKSQNDEQANQFIKKIRQLDIEILKNCDTHQGQIAKYKEEITQYICEQAQMTQKLNGLQSREQYLAEIIIYPRKMLKMKFKLNNLGHKCKIRFQQSSSEICSCNSKDRCSSPSRFSPNCKNLKLLTLN